MRAAPAHAIRQQESRHANRHLLAPSILTRFGSPRVTVTAATTRLTILEIENVKMRNSNSIWSKNGYNHVKVS